MKKRIKNIGTLVLILLLLLGVMESNAALVSDNTGAAFITKAEFDSLKNSFQNQLDSNNSSIDSKINSAINAYITGVRSAKTVKTSIINSSWDDVSSVNGEFATEWNEPEMAFTYMIGYMRLQSGYVPLGFPTASDWIVKCLSSDAYSKITPSYLSSTSATNKRNLVTNEGTNASPTKITWAGRALRYHENWSLSRLSYIYFPVGANMWDLSYLDVPSSYGYEMRYQDFFKLSGIGDLSGSKSNLKSLWPFQMRWYYGVLPETATNVQVADWSLLTLVDNLTTSITLEKNASGKTTEYDHIISYDGTTTWRLFNTNYNYCYVSDETTLKTDDVHAKGVSGATLITDVYGVKANQNTATDTASAPYHYVTTSNDYAKRSLAVSLTKTDNLKYPNLGVIKDKKAANTIYQDQVTKNIETGGTTVKKEPATLEKGFQLLTAKKGDEIEWTPIFNYTHVHNGADTYATDNSHEVDIYFSNGPFTNKTTTSKPIQVKVGNSTALKNYATTDKRTCKIKFTMPDTGLVYVKFVPHFTGTSYLDKDWIVTLDIKNSSSYTYTRND